MTLSNLTTRQLFTGDDATVTFAIPFDFFLNNQVAVYLRDENVDPITETLQVEGELNDYTISSGNVVMATAPATGEFLLLIRASPKTQTTDFIENDPFPASDAETQHDRHTMLIQEICEKLGRAILSDITGSQTGITFPTADANKYLRWNAGGTDLINDTVDHDDLDNTHNLTTDINHNTILNNHNLTTDINHNTILNNHNLTTDINHNAILNNHNLTTDIDHNQLTNYSVVQHRNHNDALTTTTHLWSGDKISTEIAAAVAGGLGFSATLGSVLFSGGGQVVAQDNSNFFWDDTNNFLGIGTNTPDRTLTVLGDVGIIHTSISNSDHCLLIDCNVGVFEDVRALNILYNADGVVAGQDEKAILIAIDETDATGGRITGVSVISTEGGSATIEALFAGINVAPVEQLSGTFGDADSILNNAADVKAALSAGGAGAVSVMVNDNNTMTIGFDKTFQEMEFVFDTTSSGAGIAPVFEFSTGVGTFDVFGPTDGTNGMRADGVVTWLDSDIPTWAVGTGSEFLIKITRTRNNLTTTPILDSLQITATTTFKWDKNGNVNLNTLTLEAPDPLITLRAITINAKLAIHSFGEVDLIGMVEHRHSNTASMGSFWVGARSRGTEAVSTVVQNGDSILRITAAGFDGSDFEAAAQIAFEVDGAPGSNDMPGRMIFSTTPNGGTTLAEHIRIDNAGLVGIGTAGATTKLHVVTSGTAITAGSDTVAVFQDNTATTTNAAISIISGTAGNSTLNFGDSGDENIGFIDYDNSSNLMTFTTNTSTAMTIANDQAFIMRGTTTIIVSDSSTPISSNANTLSLDKNGINGLTVAGPDASDHNIHFSSPSAAPGASLKWNFNSNLLQIGTNNASAQIAFITGAGTERMRLDASGFLTIGATSGSVRLTLDTGTAGQALHLIRDNTGIDFGVSQHFFLDDVAGNVTEFVRIIGIIEDNTNGSEDGRFSVRAAVDGTENTEIIRMGASGVQVMDFDFFVDTDTIFVDATNDRVGINNSTPAVALDVTGAGLFSTTVTASTLVLAGGSITDTSGAISFGNEDLSTTGDLTINTNTLFVDSANSEVGINTLSPTHMLNIQSGTGGGSVFSLSRNNTGANFGISMTFHLDNDNNEVIEYGRITGAIVDNADGSEDGKINFNVVRAGTENTNVMIMTSTGIAIGTEVTPSSPLHVFRNMTAQSQPVVLLEQDHVTGAIPVLQIQQDDVSEGFINFVGSDRGVVPTSTVDSVASFRCEVNGTIYVIAAHVDQ